MNTKRLIGAGGALVLVAFLAAALTRADPGAASVSCGLGLPPDHPGFAEAELRKAAEFKNNGFIQVCEANLERFHISFRQKALAEARLAFEPVDLARTPFAQFDRLGSLAESVGDTRSRLYRGFRLPSGRTLTLFEHDMSADGSRIWRDPNYQAERVNGLPAHLGVFQAPSGKAISHLSWTEGRRNYELWIDANVSGTPLRDQLFSLAASLPRSVPACPNEPPVKPLEMGADGFPLDDAPAVLTVSEGEALKRPCK
jgi:hypothetical protein